MRQEGGFTLVEVMVSLAIFSLMSLAGLTVLTSSLKVKERLDVQEASFAGLQSLHAQLRADLLQAVPRPARLTDGGAEDWVFLGRGEPSDGDVFLAFVHRGGWGPLLGLAGSPLEHVALSLEDGRIVKTTALYPDGGDASTVTRTVLVENVRHVGLRYHSAGTWRSSWVSLSSDGETGDLPEAVALDFEMDGLGALHQVFRVGGGRNG